MKEEYVDELDDTLDDVEPVVDNHLSMKIFR